MTEAPERLDLAEDPMCGWWSAADAPPKARVAFVRADRYDEAVRQRDKLLGIARGALSRGSLHPDNPLRMRIAEVIAESEDDAALRRRGSEAELVDPGPQREAEAVPPEVSHGTGGKRKVGRPRSEKGRRAYELKAAGGRTWVSIARELGLSERDRGASAKVMARRHAERAGLPWPVGEGGRRS